MPREDATRVRFHEEAPSYKEGEAVEYRSASAGWIPAKVVRVNGNGTYDLDCKQDVPSDRIRAQERGPSFQAGDHVEYFSGSQGKWIPAKVLLQKTDGRLDLDCKQDVSASTVRWPSISSQLHNFTLGDFVEYYSSSQGSWISARVTALKPNGRIDLDCKADVAADSVRQPLPPPGSERLPNLLEPGESVEYFGAKMQRWISAKVFGTLGTWGGHSVAKARKKRDRAWDSTAATSDQQRSSKKARMDITGTQCDEQETEWKSCKSEHWLLWQDRQGWESGPSPWETKLTKEMEWNENKSQHWRSWQNEQEEKTGQVLQAYFHKLVRQAFAT